VRRSYKFLLRPTSRQEAALRACLEDTRQLYNAALEERREAWRMGRHQVTFSSQDAQLKKIRADDPERYGRWSFNCERAAIRRLDRAFQSFFKRVKAGHKPGYPGSRGGGGGIQSNGRTKTAPAGTRSHTPKSPVSTSRESGTSASTSTGPSRGVSRPSRRSARVVAGT